MQAIDLNADLGEGVTDDAGLLEVVTSANVACGYHAGDEAIMRAVCEESVRRGVAIGAQVSYATAPLTQGDELPVGERFGEPRGIDVPAVRRLLPPVTLRLVPGPRLDWFTGPALDTLTGSSYGVSPDSNRIGLRLDGPALARRRKEELPSEGIVLGAIQVPASGQPLVFLNDHPTTGGYPVIAVVVPEDLARCAQMRPGDEVRFRVR